MAIINNNVQNVKFLRNQNPFGTRELARQALENNKAQAADGTALLARYTITDGQTTDVKTLVGFVAELNSTKYVTIFDVEGGSEDVEKLRQEINAKLGTGVTSANTATAQLAALSGNGQSTSAETSVEGAKRYADGLKNQMDYTGVTTGTGVYVTNVTQSDGIVSATTATLPTVTDAKEAKKVVVSVSEDKGEISIERGTISSSAQTIVLTDNTDGGVNFDVNIDNSTIVQDETTKALKVASAALTQYIGDGKTIAISAADANNNKTVSTLLTLSSITPSSTTVKEEYALKNASGETIGSTIKIYKDSSLVSITYITDPADEHYQNLEYVYIDDSGNTQTEYVDMSTLVLEAEFASGVTADASGVVHGVVDQNSESFLTVGAGGFKITGVSGLVENAIEGLDATVTDSTSGNHVTITIEELDGKLVQSGLTIEENDIASASDLTELSGKTVTAITSTNGSITASINDAVGNKTYDLATDASKIKMSGFSSNGALSGITSSSSITEAFGEVEDVIEENERVTAAALTDLDDRIDTVSGDVETIKNEYISGVSVNGHAVTVANKVAPISIAAATSAATGTTAIVVNTDNSGNITLGISSIDCGYYSE